MATRYEVDGEMLAMSSLRSALVRLAHNNPELRQHLVPLLRRTAGREFSEKGKGYGETGPDVRGPGKRPPESKGKCFYETGDEGDRCYTTNNGGPGGARKGPKHKPGDGKAYEKTRWPKLVKERDKRRKERQRRKKAQAIRQQTVEVPTSAGTKAEVSALVLGSWAVHKAVGQRGWSVTFLPSGHSTMTAKTKKSALGALEAISRIPDLFRARTIADVMRHKDLFLKLPQQVSGRKPVINIEDILLDEGLAEQGSRYGKAGEFWGLTGLARVIAVGRRDINLNVFYVAIDSEGAKRRPDTRWRLKDSVLKTKMTEPKLREWARWVKRGPTTKRVREEARGDYDAKGGYIALDGGMFDG